MVLILHEVESAQIIKPADEKCLKTGILREVESREIGEVVHENINVDAAELRKTANDTNQVLAVVDSSMKKLIKDGFKEPEHTINGRKVFLKTNQLQKASYECNQDDGTVLRVFTPDELTKATTILKHYNMTETPLDIEVEKGTMTHKNGSYLTFMNPTHMTQAANFTKTLASIRTS